ncbi:MAG: hypothetical protein ACLFRD_03565 [Nitriliruptoraceae bacterium]
MPRVTCVECAGEVVVDPSGRCPEGHLVGTAGARVEHAIGTGAPHPDEPEPWIATITAEEVDGGGPEPDGVPTAARPAPVRAPGPPATAEADDPADTDDLLHELQSLSAPADHRPAHTENGSRSFNGSSSAAAPAASAADTPAASAADTPATPAADTPAAPAADTPVAPVGSDDDHRASDVAALEAMLQEFDDEPLAEVTELDAFRNGTKAEHPDGSPSEPGSSTPGSAPPGTFSAEPTQPGSSTPEPPPAGAPTPGSPPPPVSAPPQPPSTPAATADQPQSEEPRSDAAAGGDGLDLTNFTAKGTKVGNKGRGRRKRLGR